MPLWLLKFTPIWGFIKKHWKIAIAIVTFLVYSLFVFNAGYDKADTAWELKDAERIRVEQVAKEEAQRQADALKERQDAAQKEREDKLRQEKEAAEKRAAEARAEADKQRRLNSAKTKELEALQAADPNGPQPVDAGVRDILTDGQDKVRSRRRP